MTDIADHESPPSEDTIHEEQPDPQQFEDAPENEIDPILDYINSQHHQEEDMNNALQAYNVMASPTPADTPQWSINLIHTYLFYHVTQAKQVQHGSLVDRGANGGLTDIFTKSTTNVIFHNHQKKLVWDKANVENEMNQELNQSMNQQEGC